MSYKRLTPCIFIAGGKAVKWFDDRTALSDDVVSLAKHYNDKGADELIVFDLSGSDDEHDEAIDLIKKINRGDQYSHDRRRQYPPDRGCEKNTVRRRKARNTQLFKHLSIDLVEEVSKRFGKERIAVSLNDFDAPV